MSDLSRFIRRSGGLFGAIRRVVELVQGKPTLPTPAPGLPPHVPGAPGVDGPPKPERRPDDEI